MIKKTLGSEMFLKLPQKCMAILCSALLVPGIVVQASQSQPPAAGSTQPEAANLSPDQLDSLVAPIALYPDPLLAQVLAASTYPLELVQLQQWLEKNKTLKDKALADAVQKQPWDPSIQAMAALPDVVKRLVDDIQWTDELGNAFLAQQDDVMGAVQRMRAKAQEKGNLKSNEQMKVETRVVENKQVIVVEQSNPQVVYVPSYDPVVVYGPPAYPYPPIYYPPPGYYAAGMAISFGVGLAMGAAWGGGWGYNCGWGGGNNNININNNNNFINNSNRQNVGNGNRPSQQPSRGGRGNSWQHNPQHRGGAPYSNRGTANKYGGTARGASVSDRQANARRQQGRQQGGRQQAGTMDRGGAGGGRQQAGGSNRGGGGDRVGNRQTSGGSGGRNSGAFGGSSGSGSAARASGSRGSSSMGGGSRGGGRSGGGGGRRR